MAKSTLAAMAVTVIVEVQTQLLATGVSLPTAHCRPSPRALVSAPLRRVHATLMLSRVSLVRAAALMVLVVEGALETCSSIRFISPGFFYHPVLQFPFSCGPGLVHRLSKSSVNSILCLHAVSLLL